MVCSACHDLSTFNMCIFLYACLIKQWGFIIKNFDVAWNFIVYINDRELIYIHPANALALLSSECLSQSHSDKNCL